MVLPYCLLDALDAEACGLPDAPERGSTAATDIQLEAEQRAMQALHALQLAFHAAADTGSCQIARRHDLVDVPFPVAHGLATIVRRSIGLFPV